ncbi:MAG TPA: hypothetical protein DHW82_05895 [Spirochaetia bacterium]|nr:MAG: hypothetical protein A2Y41_02290 [Spirochaetes bacterium GWB1_36_13]HCL56525.1 hypothetical protein [Spirochaetia bacterium]
MKKILIFVVFLCFCSCKKDIFPDQEAPIPIVESVEVLSTGNGNLIIENTLDLEAKLLIKGKKFLNQLNLKVRLYRESDNKVKICAITYSDSDNIECEISLFNSFTYPLEFNDSGIYWVRIQNDDGFITEKWSVENVTLTIY